MDPKMLENKMLLVAEDNATNRLVVSQMLKNLGANFDMANDGLEAIALFEANDYNLALLDIEMPRKSGLDVIRHIRASEHVPEDFPIVALTAFVLDEHREKIMGAGASGIIPKPLTNVQSFGEHVGAFLKASKHTEIAPEKSINPQALDDLEATLGKDVMSDFLANIKGDLNGIAEILESEVGTLNKGILQSNLHKLLSLAGMAGADELLTQTQNLHVGLETIDEERARVDLISLNVKLNELITYINERAG